MLLGYVQKYPEKGDIPKGYLLGKGHMLFFKDKLLYVKKRHDLIRKEMRRRGFRPARTVVLKSFPKPLCNDWHPSPQDKAIIRQRLIWKLRLKPSYYRYCGRRRSLAFFLSLVRKSQ